MRERIKYLMVGLWLAVFSVALLSCSPRKTFYWEGNTVVFAGRKFEIVELKVGVARMNWSEVLLPGYIKVEDEVKEERSFSVGFDDEGVFKGDGVEAKLSPHRFGFRISVSAELDYDYFSDILPFVELVLKCKGERYFGFGEWSDYSDATGLERDIWVSEQHIGGDPENPPSPLGKVTTYFPVPFFVTSGNWGVWVEGYSRVEFDVCSDLENFRMRVWSDGAVFNFIVRESMLDVISAFLELVGKQKRPPDWAFGNWIDAIFGSESVRETARFLRENGIPATVIWTEDWAGGRWLGDIYTIAGWDTEHSKELYPDLPTLARELEEMGFKFLAYFNTFVPVEREYFEELSSAGLLVGRRDGEIVISWAPEGNSAILDITKEDAVRFIKGVMRKLAEMGFDGWMADFGEYIPPDAVFKFSGERKSGWQMRNLYPVLWAKLNFDFWKEFDPSGDWVFFSRSGFTGSWVFSPVVWQGDQNTTFERFDGIGAVVPSVLSLSFVGVAFVGPDIAGYTSGVLVPPSDKELYIRWTSLCAFLPVFRTHHGSAPALNWRFDRDRQTLEVFRRYAKVHMKLVPFFLELAREYEEKGYPPVRHMVLNWRSALKFLREKRDVFEQQFALGDRMIVAPIVERGRDEREVFIPPGIWINYFTGEEYDGGRDGKIITVKIPLGEIFVAVKKGKCIPEFEPVPSTLARVSEKYKKLWNIKTARDVKVVERCF